jgi:hypothetical protein
MYIRPGVEDSETYEKMLSRAIRSSGSQVMSGEPIKHASMRDRCYVIVGLHLMGMHIVMLHCTISYDSMNIYNV